MAPHSQTKIGVVGQPNVVASLVMKAVSRALSHRRQVPHCVQSIRCACGPLLEPMVAIWLPQRHARGSLIRRPMMGEVEDGVDDGGDEDPKKSSCMCVVSLDGASLMRRPRGYARRARDEKPPQWTAFGRLLRWAVRGRCCSDVRIVVERRLLFLLRGFLQHLNDD